MLCPEVLPLVEPQSIGRIEPFAPNLAELLDEIWHCSSASPRALHRALESMLQSDAFASQGKSEAPPKELSVFDRYFSIQPVPVGSWRQGMLKGTLTAYLRWLTDSTQGTSLDPAEWNLLASGLFHIADLLRSGSPTLDLFGEPPVRSLASLFPARRESSEVDAKRRWVTGHWVFAVLINAEILALELFQQELDSGHIEQAGLRLLDAAHVLRTCAAAMRYAADFPRGDYETVIRPSMPPTFSGLMFANHAYMIRKMTSLRPLLSQLPAELHAQQDIYSGALNSMFDDHIAICGHFVQAKPSLRCPGRGSLDLLGQLKDVRHELVSRPARKAGST